MSKIRINESDNPPNKVTLSGDSTVVKVTDNTETYVIKVGANQGPQGAQGAMGNTGATGSFSEYVGSFNGSTGALEGVSSFNGSTGAVEGVASVNGSTGSVSNVALTTGATFSGIAVFGATAEFDGNILVAEDKVIQIGGDTEKLIFNGGSSRIDIVAGNIIVGSGAGSALLNSAGDGDTVIRYENDKISFEAGGTTNIEFTGTAGITFGSNIDVNDYEIKGAELKDYSETVFANGNISGAVSIDMAMGNVQTAKCSTGSCTIAFSNPPLDGIAGSVTLILEDGGTGSGVVWHSSVAWPGGTAPTLTSPGMDVLSFLTPNAGVTYYGFVGGINFS